MGYFVVAALMIIVIEADYAAFLAIVDLIACRTLIHALCARVFAQVFLHAQLDVGPVPQQIIFDVQIVENAGIGDGQAVAKGALIGEGV